MIKSMISIFMHLLFVVVLGATMVSTPPKGTLQLELFDFNCKPIDTLNVEDYIFTNTHIRFRTIGRGIIKYEKSTINEIHGSVVGKPGEFLERSPLFEIENMLNSQCKQNFANLGNKSPKNTYN
jgi:hypothetical protein